MILDVFAVFQLSIFYFCELYSCFPIPKLFLIFIKTIRLQCQQSMKILKLHVKITLVHVTELFKSRSDHVAQSPVPSISEIANIAFTLITVET